jgi:dCMP deaminase
MSRRIGALLVKDKIIFSTGYNGPPRGTPDCDKRWTVDKIFKDKYTKDIVSETKGKCPRYAIGCKSGEQMEICVAAHAEENCILSAARLGVSVKDSTMYMTCGIPCTKCLIKIINSGVSELVVTTLETYDESSLYLLHNSDIKVRFYDFIK